MKLLLTRLKEVLFAGIAIACCAGTLLAKAQEVRDVRNVGYMKSPPADLREKFPLCEEFLQINWISKSRQIGYGQFEADLENKQGAPIGKGTVSILVFMKWQPDMGYEVSYFKNQGKLDALFEALREGKIGPAWGGTGYIVSYGEEEFVLNYLAMVDDVSFRIVLSDHQKTVCLVYPDGKRAWIAERKETGKIYSQELFKSLFEKLKSQGAEISEHELAKSWELDLNGDGIPDYVTFSYRGFVTYSSGEGKYKTSVLNAKKKPLRNSEDRDTKNILSSDYRKCTTKLDDSKYITTDGKNYFLNNQCNLTKGTSHGVGD